MRRATAIATVGVSLFAAVALADLRWQALYATSYCQGTRTASGEPVYVGEVAENTLPFGTLIAVKPAVYGLRRFRVEDRIGWGSEIDFYTPDCQQAIDFGHRTELIRVVKKR